MDFSGDFRHFRASPAGGNVPPGSPSRRKIRRSAHRLPAAVIRMADPTISPWSSFV